MSPFIPLLTILLTICLSGAVYGAELPEKCRQRPERGPCKAMFERFYYDQGAKACRPFFYGGCGLEAPFESREECAQVCEGPTPKKKAGSGLYYDPVEDDPRHAGVFAKIDAEVKEALAGHPRKGSMGFIHIIWDTKQKILKQKYNIDWKTPAELNPQVMFD